MSLLIRPAGTQAAAGIPRRGFLRNLGAGALALAASRALGGCGDSVISSMPYQEPGRMDGGAPVRTFDATLSPDQRILSLSDRLDQLLQRDSRFHLYVEENVFFTNDFLSYCKTNWGESGTILIVTSLERAADAVLKIESQLKNSYNVSKFVPEVRFRVGTWLLDTIMAKADPLFISISPPKPSGFATTALYSPMIAHEYGHFLSFYDLQGNQVIPTLTKPYQNYYKNIFDLEMAEMKTKGYIERYHLGKIKYIPWLSSELTQEEYYVLTELVANKVAATMVGEQRMHELFTSEFEALSLQGLVGPNPQAWILICYIHYCKLYNIPKWEKIFTDELFKRNLATSQDLASALAKLDQFYKSVQLLDH